MVSTMNLRTPFCQLFHYINLSYTLWISRCIAAAKERIPESIENDVTGVSERSQQRGNLKDNGYIQSAVTSFLYSGLS